MTTPSTKIGWIVAFVLLVALTPALYTYADARGDVSRDRNRTTETTPEPEPEEESSNIIFSPGSSPGGGISNSTDGSVESGGNTGGNVTTGDESVEVFEVNIGPMNDTNDDDDEDEEVEEPVVEPEPPCGTRSRTNCAAQDPVRTR